VSVAAAADEGEDADIEVDETAGEGCDSRGGKTADEASGAVEVDERGEVFGDEMFDETEESDERGETCEPSVEESFESVERRFFL